MWIGVRRAGGGGILGRVEGVVEIFGGGLRVFRVSR